MCQHSSVFISDKLTFVDYESLDTNYAAYDLSTYITSTLGKTGFFLAMDMHTEHMLVTCIVGPQPVHVVSAGEDIYKYYKCITAHIF